MTALRPDGVKLVDAQGVNGQIVLVREDGSLAPAPILMFEGALVDNRDGTVTIVIPDEE